MDDVPYTGDLDLAAVTTRNDLIALLQTVYVRADRPSLRTLETRTRHEETPLSRTRVSEMRRGKRFPGKAVMIAFLRACGVPDGGLEPWRRAWERVSGDEGPVRSEATQTVPGQPVTEITGTVDPAEMSQLREQVSRLTEDNERLRSQLAASTRQSADKVRQSMWHFPDGARITLVCSRLPADRCPAHSDPEDLNYVRFSDLADLDALIEVYGAIRAYNPTSQVVIMAAQDLRYRDVASHLVLIGGLAWETVSPLLSLIFPIPIQAGDPFDRGAIVVNDPDGREHEYPYQTVDGVLVEDVGFFARGENPSAPKRTLTICGGVTTRGVLGAARCFIDWEMRERNEGYVASRFSDSPSYCIVMRVPIVNKDPLTPDLSKKENRLFEWSDDDSEAR